MSEWECYIRLYGDELFGSVEKYKREVVGRYSSWLKDK